MSNFILQALQNEPITVYGNGTQTRSFCYVDDLVDALVRLMNTTSDELTGPINLGKPAQCTMLELAEKVRALTGSKSSIVFQPLPSDDPVQRQPDITLARMQLGWAPRVELEEGLMKTIAYFEKLLSAS